MIRPLRLKRELAKAPSPPSTSSLSVARLWVDSGIYHLDHPFDYLIPDSLSDQVRIGVRVQVPFSSREVEALVIERLSLDSLSTRSSLKSISKVLSPHSVATTETIELIGQVALRWAAHPFDILRAAIAPRVASVDKSVKISTKEYGGVTEKSGKEQLRTYLHMPPAQDPMAIISQLAKKQSILGSVLILMPDARSVKRLHLFLPDALILDSSLERTQRYRNFLHSRDSHLQIVIGNRSAIFAPIPDLKTIIVFDEGSENHFEPRSPGWNVRDVAIMRSLQSDISLFFAGFSPSSEIARLIELKWISYRSENSKIRVKNFSQHSGELLPSPLIAEIRMAQKKGPVLFLAPRKGYSQAISCAQCRNVGLCSCGGKLIRPRHNAAIECVICSTVYVDWSCAWCHGRKPFLFGRGSDRFAYEIGVAFPKVAIFQSSGENILERFEADEGFVIATPGACPIASHGYSLVVILEGDRFFAQSDMRAHERSREIFFATAALAQEDSLVALVIDGKNPIIGAMSAWKPSLLSQRELRERLEANLPPFTRAITLDIDRSESQQLLRGLKKSQDDGRLPSSSQFLGPIPLQGNFDRIVLLAPIADGEKLVDLIHEFARRRSSGKRALPSIRIDPYSLSR